MPVLVVRHAHALARTTWEGDDSLRDLSERGRRQAEALVRILQPFEPTRVLSSPHVRCMETVIPLAAKLGLPVEPAGALAEGCGDGVIELVRSFPGSSVVLCSHGDVIPELLAGLVDEDRLDLGSKPRVEKASVWVLSCRKGRFSEARYIKPPDV